ncbi:uncharacterized protein N7496_002342 [Penicillium cataractarum]|uniref:Siderophore biosynthesis enzyme n=1 Tax=Penicillium cataractarum TaxID=2100454 RepID=A0A9W9VGI8_9EURO|nr:uncharacterized protein N7496_002342 [Penicillium cataractarum]KAJ5379914.1 hypothetical protein N7496_002342 [Penicillium cataractarum]
MKAFALPVLLGLAGLATARTDLGGCISSQTTNQWHEASMIWWVPDTGEICDFVDCGGGRAPPKTTQPGCPLYSGTATLTPSYMPGWGPNGKLAATTTTVAQTTASTKTTATGEASEKTTTQTESEGSMVTAAPTSSPVVSLTTITSSTSKVANSTASGNSTTSATTPVHTGGASGFAATNLAGVMAIVAAAVGAVAL